MSSHAMVDVGNDFVLKVARVASGGVCYGIYSVLMALVVSIFARRGFATRKSNIFLLAVTSLMFIGGTMFFCFDVADLVRRLQIILVEESGQHIGEKLRIADEELKNTFYTGQMLFVFMLILGDSVVVWRTWTICSDLRKWVAVAIATWIGSLIAGLFELGCDIHTHWALDVTTSVASAGAQTCAHADLSSFTLSYVTNILCTLIITFRTWQHRRIMSAYLGKARRKTQVEKVLTLIIESGFFYLVIYTLQAIPIYGAKLDQDGMTAFNVVNAIIQQALGIYPTLVIVLVKMQKSLWDAKEISEVVHSTSIQFTTSTCQATTNTMINGYAGHHTQHHSQYTGTTASGTQSNTEKGCNRSSMDPEKVEAHGDELDHWEGARLHQTL